MNDLKDRVTAFENRYANDRETLFRIEARACKIFGLWVAEEKLKLDDMSGDTYGRRLISENLKEPGIEDVMRSVRSDLDAQGAAYTDEELYRQFEQAMAMAEAQIRSQPAA